MTRSIRCRLAAPRTAALVAVAGLAALGACGGTTADDDADRPSAPTQQTTTTVDVASCERIAGPRLAIATGEERNEPWFEGGDPASGGGLEGAVATAVAAQLGYGPDDIEWTSTELDRTDVDLGDADLAIDHLSVDDRHAGITLSGEAYYEVPYAISTRSADLELGADPTATLAELELATWDDPEMVDQMEAQLGDVGPLTTYESLADLLEASATGEVEASVLPLTTAIGIARADPANRILGRLATTGEGVKFAIGLPDGSPLGPCVDTALTALRAEGELDALVAEWIDPVAPPIDLD